MRVEVSGLDPPTSTLRTELDLASPGQKGLEGAFPPQSRQVPLAHRMSTALPAEWRRRAQFSSPHTTYSKHRHPDSVVPDTFSLGRTPTR
jgi:hypothetical protein